MESKKGERERKRDAKPEAQSFFSFTCRNQGDQSINPLLHRCQNFTYLDTTIKFLCLMKFQMHKLFWCWIASILVSSSLHHTSLLFYCLASQANYNAYKEQITQKKKNSINNLEPDEKLWTNNACVVLIVCVVLSSSSFFP